MDLHWRTNLGVSVFHAADQLRRGAALRPELEAALREPTAKLVQSIAEERLSPALFWRHLVPQAAEFDSMRRLAEVVLVKLQGRTEARIRIPRFQRNLTAIRDAFVEAYSQPPDQTGALKQRWVQECPGLFAGIKNWTDENVLVPEATIFLVPPV